MHRIVLAMILATVDFTALAADVGVSINIGEPGFYGQITLGNAPPPQLMYQQPVIIEQVRGAPAPPPIYLHVPPGHAKHWNKHCRQYAACGRPVYFVQDRWNNDVYVPNYREHGERRGERHDDDRGERHHDKDNRDRDERDRHRRNRDD